MERRHLLAAAFAGVLCLPAFAQDAVVIRSSDGGSDQPRLTVTQSVGPANAEVRVDRSNLVPGAGTPQLGTTTNRWGSAFLTNLDVSGSATIVNLSASGSTTLGIPGTGNGLISIQDEIDGNLMPNPAAIPPGLNIGGFNAGERWNGIYSSSIDTNAGANFSGGMIATNGIQLGTGGTGNGLITIDDEIQGNLMPNPAAIPPGLNIGGFNAGERWNAIYANSIDTSVGANFSGGMIATNGIQLGTGGTGNGLITIDDEIQGNLMPNPAAIPPGLDIGGFNAGERWNAIYANSIDTSVGASFSGGMIATNGIQLGTGGTGNGLITIDDEIQGNLMPNPAAIPPGLDIGGFNAGERWNVIYANSIDTSVGANFSGGLSASSGIQLGIGGTGNGLITIDDEIQGNLMPNPAAIPPGLNIGGFNAGERWNVIYANSIDTSVGANFSGGLFASSGIQLGIGGPGNGLITIDDEIQGNLLPNPAAIPPGLDIGGMGAGQRWNVIYANSIDTSVGANFSGGLFASSGIQLGIGGPGNGLITIDDEIQGNLLPNPAAIPPGLDIGGMGAGQRWNVIYANSIDTSAGANFSGGMSASGGVILGQGFTNTITFNDAVNSSILPNGAFNLGSGPAPWTNLFALAVNIGDTETISDGGTNRLLINSALASNQTSSHWTSGFQLKSAGFPSPHRLDFLEGVGTRVNQAFSQTTGTVLLPLELPQHVFGGATTWTSVTVHYATAGTGVINATRVYVGGVNVVTDPGPHLGAGTYTVVVNAPITGQAYLAIDLGLPAGTDTVDIQQARVDLQY